MALSFIESLPDSKIELKIRKQLFTPGELLPFNLTDEGTKHGSPGVFQESVEQAGALMHLPYTVRKGLASFPAPYIP